MYAYSAIAELDLLELNDSAFFQKKLFFVFAGGNGNENRTHVYVITFYYVYQKGNYV